MANTTKASRRSFAGSSLLRSSPLGEHASRRRGDDGERGLRRASDDIQSTIEASRQSLPGGSILRLALHSIKAKIDKSHLDHEASSVLTLAWIKVFGIPIPAKTEDIVKEIASTMGDPLEVDEISLMRTDPVRVKVFSRDRFVEIFINSMGYEIKFEAEGGVVGKKKCLVYDHFHKIHVHKKYDDEDDEAESSESNLKTEWEKMAEKFGGDKHQSPIHKSGDGNTKHKGKQNKDFPSDREDMCSDMVVFHPKSQGEDVMIVNTPKDNFIEGENLDNNEGDVHEEEFTDVLQIVPLAFRFPSETRSEVDLERKEEDKVTLETHGSSSLQEAQVIA